MKAAITKAAAERARRARGISPKITLVEALGDPKLFGDTFGAKQALARRQPDRA